MISSSISVSLYRFASGQAAAFLSFGAAERATALRVMVAGREAAGQANAIRFVAPAAPATLGTLTRRFVPAGSFPAHGADAMCGVTATALIAV